LKASIRTEGQKIILEPTLLNERDWIVIKTLVSKPDKEITIDGRIAGVREIRQLEEPPHFMALVIAGIGSFFFGIIYGAYQLFNMQSPSEFQSFFVSIIAIILGYGLMFVAFFSDAKARKRYRKLINSIFA
jgi:hypothetical protein